MTKSKISLYFLGTDEFATTILKRLVEDPVFDVRGVVVPPDRPAGRSQTLTPCPLKRFADSCSMPVFYSTEELLGREVDFLVVASYGRILPSKILEIPRIAPLNVHPSLLPKYRGASPIPSAILSGDSVTGTCVMKMVPKMDAGPVYAFSEVPILPEDDAQTLRTKLADFSAELLAQTIPGIVAGDLESLLQDDSRATYCKEIERTAGEVLWKLDDAGTIDRKRRAYFPWPGIYTLFNGKRLKIHRGYALEGPVSHAGLVRAVDGKIAVETMGGLFVLEEVQLEGKNPMKIDEFVRGYPDFAGSVLQ